LKEAIAKMPEEEAKYHMKRCVDSGLWVPDASTLQQTESEEKEPAKIDDSLDLD
jgi:cell division cycle protein 37